jgi:hypothetical protein
MVSTDTIQTLLKQRQNLKQALLDLRQEIETLDATSLDLVNKNVNSRKNPPLEESKPLELAGPMTANNFKNDQAVSKKPDTEPGANTVTNAEKGEPSEAKAMPPEVQNEPKLRKNLSEKDQKNTDSPDVQLHQTVEQTEILPPKYLIELSEDSEHVLAAAKSLSNYYLEHPSGVAPAQLGALDAAIVAFETSEKARESKTYHQLQTTYRIVASQAFVEHKINGTTLVDSKGGVPILWILPLCIAALVLIGFPALLFVRTMATEMFVEGFAIELIWVFGASAAFIWGMAGALTLVALTIALRVYRREYDADVRYASVLRGVLGGVIGSCSFLVLETWIPVSSAAAEFSINICAFVTGVLSNIVFIGLRRAITMITNLIEPDKALHCEEKVEK